MSGHRREPVRGDDHVHVRGSPWMAACRREHAADRSVIGDRVVDGANGAKREGAVRAGAESAAEVLG